MQTSSNLNYAIDEVVSEVAWSEFYSGEFYVPFFFRIQGSSRSRERSARFGGLGKYAAKTPTAQAERDQITQEAEQNLVHGAYGKTVELERELIDDAEWPVLEEISEELGYMARFTMESDGAAVFNDITGGATYTTDQGKPIAYTAHVNAAGGNSQNNALTNALNQAGLKDSRQKGRDFKNARGELMYARHTLLIVPNELETTGWEQVRSVAKPDTTNNNPNFFAGMSMVAWDLLTDSNAWGLIDPRLMKKYLKWFMRIMFETWGDGDYDTGTKRIGGYYRESHGCSHWPWIVWNNPS